VRSFALGRPLDSRIDFPIALSRSPRSDVPSIGTHRTQDQNSRQRAYASGGDPFPHVWDI